MSLLFLKLAMKRKAFFALVILFLTQPVLGQVASLKINSDLILHPNQIANVFMITADKINKTSTWDWSELQFQVPYKTTWSQVQAKGPLSLNVHTDALNSRELSFELYWQNPVLNVGQFAIHDRVVKEVDGVTIIINVDGTCSNVNWTANNGNWKIRGKLLWGIAGGDIQVQWKEFEFQSNPAAPQPSFTSGPCVGPDVIQQTLRDNVNAVVGDQVKMRQLMQNAILSWMNRSLHTMTADLMKTRTNTLRPNLDLEWDPQFMITLPSGMIRVPGYMTLRRAGIATMPAVIDRTLADADYAAATETGFILPKNALENIAAFLHETGDLTKRYKSTQVKGFQDMFTSSFSAGVVWPDLLKFSTSTVFYFDLASDAAPQIQNVRSGSSTQGGLVYDVKAPIVIYDWAPSRGNYIPYVDLRSTVTGTFRAAIKSQNLQVQVVPASMPVTARFRSEYKAIRAVDERIDTARLSTAAKDFLNSKVTSVAIPSWSFGTDIKSSYGDLKLFKQSVMVPVSFVKK